ncbi:MAG: hypothetical protein K9W44_09870 [Candidatus Lokiarchaeota archaeon]|nr:hypothetical protein [Candidatus Harpocratesius repetitus]
MGEKTGFITRIKHFIITRKSKDSTQKESNNVPNVGKNSENHLNKAEIQKKLNGTTLMVYFVLLNKHNTGVRELQRNLELSSPSVARYHLDKLVELNLVSNNNGVYQLQHKADIPVLSTWVLLGRWLLPRSIFMAIFTTCFFIGYLGFIFFTWNRDSAIVIIFGIVILIYLWYDVFYHLNHRPI